MEAAIIQCKKELSKEDWQSLADKMKMLLGKPGESSVE